MTLGNGRAKLEEKRRDAVLKRIGIGTVTGDRPETVNEREENDKKA